MSARAQISDRDLHAFIDGELDEASRQSVAAAIDRDEELRRRVADFESDRNRLAQLHSHLLWERVPEKWIDRIERHRSVRRQPAFSVGAAMALAAALLLIIAGGIVYRQIAPPRGSIVEEALAARNGTLAVRRMATVEAIPPSRDASGIVASALKMHLKAPDLSAMGYRLSGIRIYGGVPGGKAVELLYRQKDKGVFALYLRHPTGEPRFDQFKRGELRVCIWQDDVLGTVMTGRMSAAEMQRLASLAYTGLES